MSVGYIPFEVNVEEAKHRQETACERQNAADGLFHRSVPSRLVGGGDRDTADFVEGEAATLHEVLVIELQDALTA